MPTTIDILTFKGDYSRTLRGSWKLETGIKTSSVESDNDMSLRIGTVDEPLLDPALSNHFQYLEQINAVYINLSGKVNKKIEAQVGLRAEHTHSIARSLNLDQKVVRDFLNLFPSLFLSNHISENHSLSFSYGHRIDRPNYQNLNPARSYLDPYTFSRGNPFLKPQYTHSLEFKHGYKQKIFTSTGANYVSDFMFFLVQPVDNRSTERIPENIGTLQAYYLTISFPITVNKNWNFQANILGNYSRLQYLFQGNPLTMEQVSGRFNGTNSILLGKGWSAEVLGWVSTPSVMAYFYSPWLGALDAGIQKSFATSWRAKLSVQDLLHTNRIIADGRAPGFSQDIKISFDSRIAMLNISYSFRNQQLKSSRQRKMASEEEMQRAN